MRYFITILIVACIIGCKGQEIVIKDKFTTVTGVNFDSISFSPVRQSYIVYDDDPHYTERERIALSIYHNPHNWKYNDCKEILLQDLKECSRTCYVCKFTETFILPK